MSLRCMQQVEVDIRILLELQEATDLVWLP